MTRSIFAAIVLATCVACALSAAPKPQQDGVHGAVVDENGAPIAEVMVWSNRDSGPVGGKPWSTKTGADGGFRLDGAGAMIHFSKEKYEHLASVVKNSASAEYVLKAAENDFVLRKCGPAPAGERAFGQDNFRFTANPRPFKVLGGKPDVDYVEWVLQAKGTKVGVELWFGPYAISLLPYDEQLIGADTFSMRNIALENIGEIGIDTKGTTGGKHWRHFAIVGSGVRYQDADDEQAKLFDTVIESACGSRPEQK